MSRLRVFAEAVWEFIVGDDWRLAAGVAVAIGVTALVADGGEVAAWWIIPVVVAALLGLSVWRSARPPS